MVDNIVYELANLGLTLLCVGVLAVITIWVGDNLK